MPPIPDLPREVSQENTFYVFREHSNCRPIGIPTDRPVCTYLNFSHHDKSQSRLRMGRKWRSVWLPNFNRMPYGSRDIPRCWRRIKSTRKTSTVFSPRFVELGIVLLNRHPACVKALATGIQEKTCSLEAPRALCILTRVSVGFCWSCVYETDRR